MIEVHLPRCKDKLMLHQCIDALKDAKLQQGYRLLFPSPGKACALGVICAGVSEEVMRKANQLDFTINGNKQTIANLNDNFYMPFSTIARILKAVLRGDEVIYIERYRK